MRADSCRYHSFDRSRSLDIYRRERAYIFAAADHHAHVSPGQAELLSATFQKTVEASSKQAWVADELFTKLQAGD